MKKSILFAAVLLAGTAHAAPVALTGDYVKAGVSDAGTLGSNSTASPGLLYDPTGTQNFGVNDYLTPGTPWDMFSVSTDETGLKVNNNSSVGSAGMATVSGPTDLSSGTTNSATWSGELAGFFGISNTYTFGDDGERIDVVTTITALVDLTNLVFARAIDPDPDVKTYGSYVTENGRGDVAKGLSATDWVHSVGTSTGLPLGLYTNSSITHNSAVTGWTTDPLTYLAGTDIGDGDNTIGLGFDIGSLLAGQSIDITYSYVMGGSLDTVDIPVGATPLPGVVWLFGSGLVGLFGFSRRKKS